VSDAPATAQAPVQEKPPSKLLEVRNLRVTFETEDGLLTAVSDASFSVDRGETLGIVGESGSGKSVANLTVLGLTRAPGTRIEGQIFFDGEDLLAVEPHRLEDVRGNDIAMIFQDPLTSLHPYYRVGWQMVEAVQAHQDVNRDAARKRSVDLLKLVGIPEAERRFDQYPHEFSGGMRQRVMIAMSLVNDPKLLIADEPTTALDVTIQAQILRLIERLQKEFEMGVIMITHDLGVVADVADEVNVMYAGRIVEVGTLEDLFYDPLHPYAWGLLGSIARIDRGSQSQPRLSQIKGQPPSLLAPPKGCPFRPRCPHAFDKCTELPPLEHRAGSPGHLDRCWLSPEQKQSLRVIQAGTIGLEAPSVTGARP
jgi:peptide/nickel transport system ATP-binding protein